MMQPEQAAILIEQVFTRILHEQMAGIPILNNRLRVETVGFRIYQGRCVGVLITPWLMCLVMLPAEGEEWGDLKLGSKQEYRFPANSFRFMVNRVDGIGCYNSYSLHSPMHEFHSQEHAVAAAENFMQTLMVEVKSAEQNIPDEALLGRILQGEEAADLSRFETIGSVAAEGCSNTVKDKVSGAGGGISRRDLLRGGFTSDGRNG